jgi:hypothetical protein
MINGDLIGITDGRCCFDDDFSTNAHNTLRNKTCRMSAGAS